MSYQCCKCDNVLHTQGPIAASIDWTREDFAFNQNEKLSLSDTLEIDDFKALTSKLNDPKEFSIKFQSRLKGKQENFRIKEYKVLRSEANTFTSSIIICCDKCGSCCQYNI